MVKRILVIDDEKPIRILLTKILEKEGFEVTTAGDGDEGTRRQQADPFDLVITDLIMPGKEGIELIREFKKDYPQTPIIAISGGGMVAAQGYLKTAKVMGAEDTIEKPVIKDVIIEKVNRVLSQYV